MSLYLISIFLLHLQPVVFTGVLVQFFPAMVYTTFPVLLYLILNLELQTKPLVFMHLPDLYFPSEVYTTFPLPNPNGLFLTAIQTSNVYK